MSDKSLPEYARVVVIGGGIIGCSVAYHLAEAGCEVVLLERDQLTSGTTWHAAGLMTTYGSGSETTLGIRQHSMQLYKRLEEETGQQTGFNPCGFIEVAADDDRLEEYRRITAFNRLHGNEIHELSPREVGELFPYADVNTMKAGFYAENDGRINPVDVTMALAKGARMKGALIYQNTPVRGVLTRNGAVTGVRTDRGEIRSEFVVNCAGMWARQLGEQSRRGDPQPGGRALLPHYRAHRRRAGRPARARGSGFGPRLLSRRDWRHHGRDCSSPSAHRGRSTAFHRGLLVRRTGARLGPADAVPRKAAMERGCRSRWKAGIRKFFCGPESFTPDLGAGGRRGARAAQLLRLRRPELGRHHHRRRATAASIAHWMVEGRPDVDVTGINIDRFHKLPVQPGVPQAAGARIARPGLRLPLPRPVVGHRTQCAPQVARSTSAWQTRRAHFRDVSGWECPGWYAPEGDTSRSPTA